MGATAINLSPMILSVFIYIVIAVQANLLFASSSHTNRVWTKLYRHISLIDVRSDRVLIEVVRPQNHGQSLPHWGVFSTDGGVLLITVSKLPFFRRLATVWSDRSHTYTATQNYLLRDVNIYPGAIYPEHNLPNVNDIDQSGDAMTVERLE